MFEKGFEEFKKIVNSNSEQDKMDKAIEKWKTNIDKKFIDDIFNKQNEFNKDNLPLALLSLYKSDSKAKVMAFCMLLEATCEILPYIPPLENIPLHPEKLKFIYHTIAGVYDHCDNGIGECMGLIILDNDAKIELAGGEEKQLIIDGTKRKLKLIGDFFSANGCDNKSAVSMLAITLDLSTYANNDAIFSEIKRLATMDLHPECKLFLLKTMAYNNIDGAEKLVDELVDFDADRLFTILSSVGKAELLKNSKITQEKIAYSKMKSWLVYPTECGDKLDKLEFVDTMMYNDYIYYIYKFTALSMPEKGYMVGVTGGYLPNELSGEQTGHTFSKFETIGDDYKKQAMDIIKLISDYWRKEAGKK